MHFPSFLAQNDKLLLEKTEKPCPSPVLSSLSSSDQSLSFPPHPTTDTQNDENTQKEIEPGSPLYMDRLRHMYQLRIGQGLLNAFYQGTCKLVAHHIDSYNDFIRYHLPLIFEQLSPKTIFYDYCPKQNQYMTEIRLYFSNVQFQRPFFVKNSGISHVVTPACHVQPARHLL
jgi:hypothetical protein